MQIRPLSPELAEKARVELNEDQNRIAADLQHIKDWLSKQPHIRARTDDQWLVTFLRGCKYSLERTKEKIDLYYSLRTLAPELFNDKYDDPRIEVFLNLGAYIVLPKTATPSSPRIAIVRPGAVDLEQISVVNFVANVALIQKILLNDDDTAAIAGLQWIIDLKDISIGVLAQITLSLMRKITIYSQEATPMRMKGSFFMNSPSFFETVINTMKSFLNEKNRNRLFVCKTNEDLHKHIPKDILPEEYGGHSGSIKNITGYWQVKKQEYSSWLEEDEKYSTDESKRPGQPKTAETLFGVDGSFRRLDFD